MAKISLRKPTRNGGFSARANFMGLLATTLETLRDGDFTTRLPSDWTGVEGKVADSFNQIASRLERFNLGLLRLRQRVGQEGKIGERLAMGDAIGNWAERIEAINALVDEL